MSSYLRLVALCILALLLGLMFYSVIRGGAVQPRVPGRSERGTISATKMHPTFTLPPYVHSKDRDVRTAAARELKSVIDLPEFAKKYPDELFSSMFIASKKPAKLKVPDTFVDRVRGMFARYPGGTEKLDFIENQNIVTTYNRFTDETSLFNEVRRYRPGYMERLPAEDEARVEDLINASSGADKCDFCRMDRSAEDIFGRVEGDHCFTASNVAKYEQYHGLIIGKKHHPLLVDPEVITDYVLTAKRWFAKVHEMDKKALYPHAMLDAGPRASASQMHSHMQISLTQDRYFSKAEHTRQSAIDYEEEFRGRNYWTDFLQVHDDLGLAVRSGKTMLISHLCPVKERELIIVSEDSADPSFGRMISVALKAMKDDVGMRAYSMAILFRQLSPDVQHKEMELRPEDLELADNFLAPDFGRSSRKFRGENKPKSERLKKSYPSIARIVDRGSPLDRRSDVGAMEFYGANNVGADPYHIMSFLRKRTKEINAQHGIQ